MKIFLTGDVQVGKTTIIRNFLSQTGLLADGFMTYWVDAADGAGTKDLFLADYGAAAKTSEGHWIARRGEGIRLKQSDGTTKVFETYGTKILERSGKRDIVIMDELGFLESDALRFQNAVMRHLSLKLPVLGVIKPFQSDFLDAVRSHPEVALKEVTKENRDTVPGWLLKQPFYRKD